MPKMQHPKGGKPINVAPGYVDMYASQGWVKAAPKSTTDRASGQSGTAPRTTTKKEKA